VGLFMSADQLDTMLGRLRRKKALILQGLVQFHPSYGYEKFVQGFRPTGTGLECCDGVLYQFARFARKNPDRNWFF
jgi:5-methylcytosine-specific restriction endonuclease McrBC GTP-binding regulatory subunit McrB